LNKRGLPEISALVFRLFNKRRLCFFLGIAGTLVSAGPGFGEDWYISNAGGMALEPAYSRLALRGTYALSVGEAFFADLPERLWDYYDPSYRIELRCLYEEGIISRRQWSFRDAAGIPRLVAVFDGDASGFIELYNQDRLITEAHQMPGDGSDYITLYTYNKTFLIRAETRLFTPPPPVDPPEGELETTAVSKALEALPGALPLEPPADTEGKTETLWIDYYRYTRSFALRGVERRFHRTPPVLPAQDQKEEGKLLAEDPEPVLIRFPQLILGVWAENEFVKPGSVFNSEFFEDVIINSGDRILYTTDERGRILSEVRRDENDKVLGEVKNTWAGDRLVSVLWKSETEERLIEYAYDGAGDRIVERNFRDGLLERTVRRDGDREVEELYMNGAVILRAFWEDGRKVSEERVRPNRNRSNTDPADSIRTLPGGEE
jgi:hypothetical protein